LLAARLLYMQATWLGRGQVWRSHSPRRGGDQDRALPLQTPRSCLALLAKTWQEQKNSNAWRSARPSGQKPEAIPGAASREARIMGKDVRPQAAGRKLA
jgi:hypothetical protein